MERPGELMPIKAFAEAAGRSQQAIYKQIGTRLASYVHEKDGQKYIEPDGVVVNGRFGLAHFLVATLYGEA